jgi:hypothetical protein
VNRGGFHDREHAKKSVSMPEVFRDMRNFVEGHTFTDIGRKLLDTYAEYFLQYEKTHQEVLQTTPHPPLYIHPALSFFGHTQFHLL